VTPRNAEVVIVGAGIAGIAVAHALAVTHGIRDVVLVDERPPLTLTSDKSTEAYRNWWPGPDDAMVRCMNRSIDLLESWAVASGNRFLLNRRGYVYATRSPETAARFLADAEQAEAQGAGPLRTYRSVGEASAYRPSAHTGFDDHPRGADLFLDRAAIRAHFGFLADDLVAVLHARRCGWLSGQQLGMTLLEEARHAGVALVTGRVEAVETAAGRVAQVHVMTLADGPLTIAAPVCVNAAGPFARQVGALMGASLPLFSERHLKVSFEDVLGAVDRNTGLVILDDPQTLAWSAEERALFAEDPTTRWLTELLPAGIHLRPDGYHGSRTVLMLWDYHGDERYETPEFPLPPDDAYGEVVMRGMTALVPALGAYVDRLPPLWIDGGYYTKTAENRPLVGAMPVPGSFVAAGFSGFGIMAAPAAAELLAAQLVGAALPPGAEAYAAAFAPNRYDDPAYRARVAAWGATGQL
jgi:glycine/D-amino acid oxidase-like deaminating enzyme